MEDLSKGQQELVRQLSGAYDELCKECSALSDAYSRQRDFGRKLKLPCYDVNCRSHESAGALSSDFDRVFLIYKASAEQSVQASPDENRYSLSYYGISDADQAEDPDEERLKMAPKRVDDFKRFYRWAMLIGRTGDQDRAEAHGWVEHQKFLAIARKTSKGVLVNAMSQSLSDGKRHLGEFATFHLQQLWRFDVFPGTGSPEHRQNLNDEMRKWADVEGSTSDNANQNPLEGLFGQSYTDYEGVVREGWCWVRVEYKGSTMRMEHTVAGPRQVLGFSLQETDQWDKNAGKEMVPVNYRVT